MALSMMVMAACADGMQSTDQDPTTAPGDSATVIPRELSSPSPAVDGTIEGNGFTSNAKACHVTLLFCADPRLSPRIPSFCQNGGCSTTQAVNAAFSLCDSICGRSACNEIAQFANSSSC